jgi:hypothetical protein
MELGRQESMTTTEPPYEAAFSVLEALRRIFGPDCQLSVELVDSIRDLYR